MTAVARDVCWPCARGDATKLGIAAAMKFHAECVGEFGAYAGDPKQCECGCEAAAAHRSALDA